MSMDRHDIVSAMLDEYVLGTITPEQGHEIESHLRTCAECAAELGELSLVMQGLARAPEAVIPPPALKARVLRAIADQPRQTLAVVPPSRVPSAGWGSGWLAAAAAIIVVLGGALYMSYERTRQFADQLHRTDSEIAELRQRLNDYAGQTDLALSILTASDMQRIELAGSASGARAYWSATRGLLVVADQLPLPPPGRIYQVWLIGRGAPVSAGVLGSPRTGRGMLIAPPPGGIASGPVTIAITDEPPGGLPAPTGAKHLVGSI
ncbi:hypothetical protein BH18ACI5_BH18ACI5_22440 [soil metagenome]